MINMPFKNYDEFKELFVKTDNNGKKRRVNGVLLSWLKSKEVYKFYMSEDLFGRRIEKTRLSRLDSMAALLNEVKTLVERGTKNNFYPIEIIDRVYWSRTYKCDDTRGVCYDGDSRSYRYMNMDRDERVFKMKIGKMFRHLIDTSLAADIIPEPVKLWACEEITNEWTAYCAAKVPSGYILHVDKDFDAIYNGTKRCRGDFYSCMSGGKHSEFYENFVKCHAAYLTDGEGENAPIVARCIIFDEVHDEETGEVFRLAERQYSTGCDDSLKRILIEMLIRQGYIDGYKKVGAGCGDAKAFVKNDGTSLSDRDLWIENTIGPGDTLSYQDSFKYLDSDGKAYNDSGHHYEYELDSTEIELENDHEDENWSDYYGRWLDEDESTYVESRGDYFYDDDCVYAHRRNWHGVYEENCLRDDCSRIDDEWFYDDDWEFKECSECGRLFVVGYGESRYSDLLEEDFCDECCMDQAENDHKERYWFWSEFDEEYYPDEEDVKRITIDGDVKTISVRSLETLMRSGRAVCMDEENGGYAFICMDEMPAAA